MTGSRGTPEDRRRAAAADRVAYTATALTEALALVQSRGRTLEERIAAAARAGVPQHELEAMTKDGLEELPFPGVQGMIRKAYSDLYEVTGADTVMYCLAHRRKVVWMPLPGWWIHDDSLPHTGSPTDPRGCGSMWNADAPITITRKDQTA